MSEKRKLKLENAVAEYIHFKVNENKTDFPLFIDEMSKSFGSQFILQNPQVTAIEFFLARIAIDSHYLWFLFPDEIANEIFKLIYTKYLKFEEFTPKEVADKLFSYLDIMDAIQSAESKTQQSVYLRKFSETFLHSILGSNLSYFEVKGLDDQKIVDPLLVSGCSERLMKYNISWKAIKESADLIK